jgi:glycosyltransferase involved in cell wall biosynthesis
LKILFLSHKFYPDLGGIESVSEMLADGFQKAGHIVHVMTWTEEAGSKQFSFTIIRNPNKLRVIKEHFWADVVFENNPCLRMSWPMFFLKRPSVVALHTWVSRTNGKIALQDLIKQRRLKNAGQVIACSNAIRKHSWPKAIVIENSYNSTLFKSLPYTNRNKDFVFLGRLVSDKGGALAIEAFQKLKSINQNFVYQNLTLTIIGNGPELPKLQMLVQDLELNDNVCFTGSLTGVPLVNLLNQHKYMLIPSVWNEPFGIVALEGMACGCVPIASDGGGLPDAIGNAGLIFKRGDVNDLVKKMQALIADTEVVNSLRSNSETHLTNHQPNIVIDQYLRVVQEAVKSRKAR